MNFIPITFENDDIYELIPNIPRGEVVATNNELALFLETTHWHNGVPFDRELSHIKKQEEYFNARALQRKELRRQYPLIEWTHYLFSKKITLLPDQTEAPLSKKFKSFKSRIRQLETAQIQQELLAFIDTDCPYAEKIRLIKYVLGTLLKRAVGSTQDSVLLAVRDILLNIPDGKSRTAALKCLRGYFGEEFSGYHFYQMAHMPHDIFNNSTPIRLPNPREISFIPDAWQFELMEAIRNRHRVLVVAPTTSGKSFVSFFAVRSVLQQRPRYRPAPHDMRSRVVFVAPSFALVNQMLIEIQSQYPEFIVGVATARYRTNEMTCDVLITTPAMLDVLLFSPNHQRWAENLEYIIFDEIHCATIAHQEDNDNPYSRLIYNVRCPFLALTATLSRPHVFHHWLECVHGPVDCIPSLERPLIRWNSLTYFSYCHEIQQNIRFHPLCLLATSQDLKNDLQSFTHELCADECCQLYEALVASDTENNHDDLHPRHIMELVPSDSMILHRKQVSQYQSLLVARLMNLPPDILRNCFTYLRTLSPGLTFRVSPEIQDGFRGRGNTAVPVIQDCLTQLMNSEMLPALCFIIDTDFQESVVLALGRWLGGSEFPIPDIDEESSEEEFDSSKKRESKKKLVENAEDKTFAKTYAQVKKERKMDREQKRNVKRKAACARSMRKVKEFKAMYAMLRDRSITSLYSGSPDILAALYKGLQAGVFDTWLYRVFRKTGWNSNHPLLMSLLLGVGCHNAGLPKAYRDLIEVLLENRAIPFVVCTHTLGYGLNFPCKSVIVVNNHWHPISAIDFDQFSGRAGRRNFDKVGHVVLLNFSDEDAKRVFIEPISTFGICNTLQPRFVLRLMILLHQDVSPDKASSKQVIQRMMIEGMEEERDHFTVTPSTEYRLWCNLQCLFHLGFLNHEAKPSDVIPIITHIPEFQNFGFFLAYICQRGYLDAMDEVELLNCLSQFILLRNNTRCPEKHLLPPPEFLRDICDEYNDRIRNIETELFARVPDINVELLRYIQALKIPNGDHLRYNSYILDLYHNDVPYERVIQENCIPDHRLYNMVSKWDQYMAKLYYSICDSSTHRHLVDVVHKIRTKIHTILTEIKYN